MLFDGMSGILPYIANRVHLIGSDGRLLKRSSSGVISLIDPNIAQGGSAKVCDCLVVFVNTLIDSFSGSSSSPISG